MSQDFRRYGTLPSTTWRHLAQSRILIMQSILRFLSPLSLFLSLDVGYSYAENSKKECQSIPKPHTLKRWQLSSPHNFQNVWWRLGAKKILQSQKKKKIIRWKYFTLSHGRTFFLKKRLLSPAGNRSWTAIMSDRDRHREFRVGGWGPWE